MSIVEMTWRPTIESVGRKNTKYQLILALLQVWDALDGCTDKQTEKKINEILLRVL